MKRLKKNVCETSELLLNKTRAGIIAVGMLFAAIAICTKSAIDKSRKKKEDERRRKREECHDLELLDLDIMEDLDDDWD